MDKQSFIETIGSAAVEDYISSTVLPSITIAQAALESSWGRSAPGCNLFGIKGSGQTQTTQEFINGKWITIQDGFRVYDCWLDSVADHSRFLIENGRYAAAGFFACCVNLDYRGAARSLQRAGYATDPGYADKLINIIEANALHLYDKEAFTVMQSIEELKAQVDDLQGKYQTLLNTAEAHFTRINALEVLLADQDTPKWFTDEFGELALKGIVDTPKGPNVFWRLVAVAYRIMNKKT